MSFSCACAFQTAVYRICRFYDRCNALAVFANFRQVIGMKVDEISTTARVTLLGVLAMSPNVISGRTGRKHRKSHVY